MTDYTTLITSEHSGQPNFMATVALTANAIGDITTLLQGLPALFDLDTAIGAQEDVDGQWIGFSRAVGGVLLVQFFGFADDITSLGFGELGQPAVGGRFIELGEDDTSTSTLADPEYRLTLRAKILQNFWDGSAGQLETAAAELIPGACAFLDAGTRVVSILPVALLDQTLYQLLTSYDLLPRPGGVRYEIFQPVPLPYGWTTVGTAVATGASLSKVGGNSAWDSSAAILSPNAAVSVKWTVVTTNAALMGGLSANPSGSTNFANLNYAIYQQTNGQFLIYESGNSISGSVPFGNYAPGDTFQVCFDKASTVYLHNGQVVHVTTASAASLEAMFALFSPGGSVSNITIAAGI